MHRSFDAAVDRMVAQIESPADLLRLEALRDEAQDLALRFGQLLDAIVFQGSHHNPQTRGCELARSGNGLATGEIEQARQMFLEEGKGLKFQQCPAGVRPAFAPAIATARPGAEGARWRRATPEP